MATVNSHQWQSLYPGLQQAGASQEEILRIRFEDRKAQGVSINDELLAEKAIRENKEETENLIVVRAYSDRFLQYVIDYILLSNSSFIQIKNWYIMEKEFLYYKRYSKKNC